MKRTILFILSTVFLGQVYAQSNFAFHIGPNFSWNRVKDESKDLTAEGNGSTIKFSIGLSRESIIQDNVGIVTGIGYKTKNIDYKISAGGNSGNVEGKADYLEIPLALRLHTNEFTDNVSAFLQFGGYADIKLSETKLNDTQDYDSKLLKPYDFGFSFGLGGEYNISSMDNRIYLLFLYNLGLTNVITTDFTNETGTNNIKVKNDMLEVLVGYKF